jgi:hypothetical protein
MQQLCYKYTTILLHAKIGFKNCSAQLSINGSTAERFAKLRGLPYATAGGRGTPTETNASTPLKSVRSPYMMTVQIFRGLGGFCIRYEELACDNFTDEGKVIAISNRQG